MSYGPGPNSAGGLFLSSADDSGNGDGDTCNKPSDPGDGGGTPPEPPPVTPPDNPYPFPWNPPRQVSDPIITPPNKGGGSTGGPGNQGNQGWIGPGFGGNGPCVWPGCYFGPLAQELASYARRLPGTGGFGGIGTFGPGVLPIRQFCCVRLCCVVTDVPKPLAVPGSTSPYRIAVMAEDTFDDANVSGLWVTCKETGVTLSTACGLVNFYFTTLGQLAHFTRDRKS